MSIGTGPELPVLSFIRMTEPFLFLDGSFAILTSMETFTGTTQSCAAPDCTINKWSSYIPNNFGQGHADSMVTMLALSN
jgi:hypothetical protein